MTMRIEKKKSCFSKIHYDQVFFVLIEVDDDDGDDEWQSVTCKRFLSVIHIYMYKKTDKNKFLFSSSI